MIDTISTYRKPCHVFAGIMKITSVGHPRSHTHYIVCTLGKAGRLFPGQATSLRTYTYHHSVAAAAEQRLPQSMLAINTGTMLHLFARYVVGL